MSGQRGPTIPQWAKRLLFVLGILPIFGVIAVFIFIARYQVAFDEERCPYEVVELREVTAAVSVREEGRRCQDDVEEHRYVVVRQGQAEFEVGRRAGPRTAFGEGYRWEADEDGTRVEVRIYNPGQPMRSFREPLPDGGWEPPFS